MADQTPLTNNDFRKLLETPRADRTTTATPSGRTHETKPKPHGENRPKPHKPPRKPQERRLVGDEEDDGEPKYRDRAEERRKGLNPDYLQAAEQLDLLAGGVDVSKLSVEETKYLGGDINYTHLVKGLDYALLEKARAGMQRPEGEEGEEGAAKGAPAVTGPVRDMLQRQDAKINGPMARAVWDTLLQPPRRSVKDLFLPRRTAFVYDFDNEDSQDTDIPTTLRRPKADCPQVQETVFASVDGAVLARIAKVLSYVRTTADGKRLKKKDRDALLGLAAQAGQDGDAKASGAAAGASGGAGAGAGAGAAAPKKPVDDDDDIFGDAGTDYQPTRKGKGKDQAAVKEEGAKGTSYFGDARDDMSDIPVPGSSTRNGTSGASAQPASARDDDDMELEEGEAPRHQQQQQLPPPPTQQQQQPYQQPQQGHYGYDPYYAQQQQGQYSYPYAQQQQLKHNPTVPAMARNDPEKWRARPAGRRPRAADEEDEDAYGEYFPTNIGAVADGGGSDDEDLSQMDSKGAKGMTRADFNTDEEWQRYKESKETLPKAAFQFGVKRADGRKSHKDLEKDVERAFNSKMDGQLRKIERILQEKGHDHADAFRKPKEASSSMAAAMATPGRRGDETPSMRKRMRL